MKHPKHTTLGIFVLALGATIYAASDPPAPQTEKDAVVKGNTAFAPALPLSGCAQGVCGCK